MNSRIEVKTAGGNVILQSISSWALPCSRGYGRQDQSDDGRRQCNSPVIHLLVPRVTSDMISRIEMKTAGDSVTHQSISFGRCRAAGESDSRHEPVPDWLVAWIGREMP